MPRKKLTKAVKEARKKPGGSNVGKYSSKEKFVGPAGGAPKHSFPITEDGKPSKKRERAALAYARTAPNPSGIKRAVYKADPSLGK